jgi:hypothetical protein
MVTEGARLRAGSGISHDDRPTAEAGRAVVERGQAALAAGVAPESAEAAAIADELVGLFATAAHRSDDPAYRAELAWMLETFSDQRVERYWNLIGVINGWPQGPSLTPAYEWFVATLRAAR